MPRRGGCVGKEETDTTPIGLASKERGDAGYEKDGICDDCELVRLHSRRKAGPSEENRPHSEGKRVRFERSGL